MKTNSKKYRPETDIPKTTKQFRGKKKNSLNPLIVRIQKAYDNKDEKIDVSDLWKHTDHYEPRNLYASDYEENEESNEVLSEASGTDIAVASTMAYLTKFIYEKLDISIEIKRCGPEDKDEQGKSMQDELWATIIYEV